MAVRTTVNTMNRGNHITGMTVDTECGCGDGRCVVMTMAIKETRAMTGGTW